ncbi:MAG: sigma 54-interacting transcriptional regulator [Dissulfurispiraceae bacterium]|jgi:hydrogenase-4 transcriptional activator
MVNKDEFFREVTIRICSSLQIETALRSAFEYLRQHFPLDILVFNIFDYDLSSIRRVAYAAAGGIEIPDEIIPLPEKLWVQTQAPDLDIHQPFIVDSSLSNELIRSIADLVKSELRGNSALALPLWIERELIGYLSLSVKGEGRYNQNHVELIDIVAQPFAIALSNALAHERLLKYRDTLLDDNRFLNRELILQAGVEIIGENSGLRNVMEMVQQVAPLNNTVLLLGETGTGKELIANAIHFWSPRKDKPFIKVNCGAMPESLIDSELFGHEKGAFTGAVAEKRGRFERADGGTIFLDEIGELPLQAQVRLLRVLQSRVIERVGGIKTIPVNIRVIVATHQNLERMVSENQFREDLWFRLNVFPIILPPLRQRKEDIPALTRYFIAQKSKELGIAFPPAIAPGALERLMNYAWLGNVRELENLVERELIRHRGGQLMFESILTQRRSYEAGSLREANIDHAPLRLDEAMALHISRILKMTKGKIHGADGAAELLGINPSTLRWRMDRLGIKHGRLKKRD